MPKGTTKSTAKNDNIMLRVSTAEKRLLAKAAKLERRKLADFVRNTALNQAEVNIAAAAAKASEPNSTSVAVAQTD